MISKKLQSVDIFHSCHMVSVHIGYLDTLIRKKEKGDIAIILKTNKLKTYFSSSVYIDKDNKNINLKIQDDLTSLLKLHYKIIKEIDYSKNINFTSENYYQLRNLVKESSRSSVCSCSKESFPEDLYDLENFYKKDIKTCRNLWNILEKILCDNRINYIYIFNGRIPIPSTIVHFAESKKIEFSCFEDGYSSLTGSTINFVRNKNKIIHNFSTLDHFCKTSFFQKRTKLKNLLKSLYGLYFFYSRIYNFGINNILPSRYKNFSSKVQFRFKKKGEAINHFNYKYFLYTPSSSFEIAGMEKKCLIGNKQLNLEKSLKKIISILPEEYKLVTRFHPNNLNVDISGINHTKKILEKYLKKDKLVFIEPEDKVSSYSLIANAEFVFSGISTCVIESYIIGTPSKAFWMAPYSKLLPEFIIDDIRNIDKNKVKKLNFKNKFDLIYRLGLYGYSLNNSNTPNIRILLYPTIRKYILRRFIIFINKFLEK